MFEDFFLNAAKIEPEDRSRIITIKSGIHTLDSEIGGFNKGELSVWSGGNGSGKSTLLSQLAIESINQGYKTLIFSGELKPSRVLNWLMLQCAGKNNVREAYKGFYEVCDKSNESIRKWLDGKLYIYDNCSLTVTALLSAINDFVKNVAPVDTVIIDNLMTLDLNLIIKDEKTDKKTELSQYEKQSEFTSLLSQLAKNANCHIHFVCHPRKSVGYLRKVDIAGSADLTNMADNVFIVHRVGEDFKKQTKEFYKWKDDNKIYTYSNVIEVCKNRDMGVTDCFVGLYFERESKRFLNYQCELKHYGWEGQKNGFYEAENTISVQQVFGNI